MGADNTGADHRDADGRTVAGKSEPRVHTLGDSLSGTNLERAGDHNQRVTLQAVRAAGAPITRADIADLTGLTAPAIANITKRLLNDGMILKAGRQFGGRGQPATKLVVNPDGAFSIGLNIDRDHIAIVALDFLGNVRARACREVHFAMPDEVVAFFKAEVDKIVADKIIDLERLVGIGIGLPDDLGRVPVANRPDAYQVWSEIDVAALFNEVLPVPVYIENDAAAASIGEMQFGHGLRNRSFIYTIISAGLGGGLVIDGHYYRGADGRSGEIGFLPVKDENGQSQSLEDMVSLYALYDYLRKAGFEVSTPEDLENLPAEAQSRVDAWLDRAANHLFEPFLVMSCAINPEAHFIGGRLPATYIEALCTRLNRKFESYHGRIKTLAPVKRAELAVDAAARGAGILPFNDRYLPIREALMKTS
ncbi:ROK family transcriptional regulator [Asticcacaulis benevestitus DSM 16100 = ATCC BAA-896]|uniref:ROK family transcriptional regulator n=1 Tax=Asticcacaulis benevestitus DSM 16100 = ATCC BAA-896 TaxID=1121022 RepID=V4PEM1_9CAUL|nr:ROK family transcriptional regulator [Asticcacaulis benevestitus DSM 16100 = ATCC BAA-896]